MLRAHDCLMPSKIYNGKYDFDNWIRDHDFYKLSAFTNEADNKDYIVVHAPDDHEKGRNLLHIFPTPKQPYFYIEEAAYKSRTNEYDATLRRFGAKIVPNDWAYGSNDVTHGKAFRVDFPNDIKRKSAAAALEHLGKTYQSNRPLTSVITLDYSLTVKQLPTRMAFDSETDPTEAPTLTNPIGRMLVICAIGYQMGSGREPWESNSKVKPYTFMLQDMTDYSEANDVLKPFFETVFHYSTSAGFYSAKWDVPYTQIRAGRLGLKWDWDFIGVMDMHNVYTVMQLFKWDAQKFDLDSVATREFGEGKAEHDYALLTPWWRAKDKRLVTYCMKDADLCRRIDEKWSAVDSRLVATNLTYTRPDAYVAYLQGIESMCVKKLNERQPKEVLYTPFRKKFESQVGGAIVFAPQRGVYPWTVFLDFESMYNKIQQSFNIGFDTYDVNGEIVTPRARFTNKKQSVVGVILRELEQWRAYYKKLRDSYPIYSEKWNEFEKKQWTVKYYLVSMFGVQGSPDSFIYNPDVADSITWFGKQMISVARQIAEAAGYFVLYGDSVSKDTRVRVTKRIGNVLDCPIEELWNEYSFKAQTRLDGKEEIVCQPPFIETITMAEKIIRCGKSEEHLNKKPHKGSLHVTYKPIKRIIRHKTNKLMYRITTDVSHLDVTQDHSCLKLLDNGNVIECKPTDLRIGDYLPAYHPKIFTPEELQKLSISHLGIKPKIPIEIVASRSKNVSLANLNMTNSARRRIGQIESSKWKEDEYVRMQMKARSVTPNKFELRFANLFEDELEYVGDGKLIIGGKCPDFKAKYGRKKLVELYGDYFHNDDQVVPRIQHFLSFGYETLILWESELAQMSEHEIKDKVLTFLNHNTIYPHKEKVISIECLGNYNDYVYDFEVEDSHTFWANGVFVHNTDSICLTIPSIPTFDIETGLPIVLEKMNELRHKIEIAVNYYAKTRFKVTDPKMEVGIDKIFRAMYLGHSKKRYAGELVWKGVRLDDILVHTTITIHDPLEDARELVKLIKRGTSIKSAKFVKEETDPFGMGSRVIFADFVIKDNAESSTSEVRLAIEALQGRIDSWQQIGTEKIPSPMLYIAGFESKRVDWPEYVQKYQKKLFTILTDKVIGKDPSTLKDKDLYYFSSLTHEADLDMLNYTSEQINEVYAGKHDMEILQRKTVRRKLSDYRTTREKNNNGKSEEKSAGLVSTDESTEVSTYRLPPHVRAAEIWQTINKKEFGVAQEIKYWLADDEGKSVIPFVEGQVPDKLPRPVYDYTKKQMSNIIERMDIPSIQVDSGLINSAF